MGCGTSILAETSEGDTHKLKGERTAWKVCMTRSATQFCGATWSTPVVIILVL